MFFFTKLGMCIDIVEISFGSNTQLQIRGGIQLIFFLFLHENICCGYSLEAPLMSTHNICFCGEIRKVSAFF